MMPEWLVASDVIHFHRALIEEFGDLHGIRDPGALESTLARPINLIAYEPKTPIHELAASYGFGFAKNHVFNDGNKRISLTVIDVFLALNGMELIAEEVEAVCVIKDVATSTMDEADLAAWIKERSGPFDLDGE
ncbi:MAG: death-on-curing protein [Rhodothermales bacterium]|jgi:death-on-curing protein